MIDSKPLLLVVDEPGILRKKNKVGAVVMLVAINGATAAVSMQNMRNAKKLSTR